MVVSKKLCVILVLTLLKVIEIQSQSLDYEEITGANNFTVGLLTDDSVLIHSVTLNAPAINGQTAVQNVIWYGNHIITKIEGIDLREGGNGGTLNQILAGGGVSYRSTQIVIHSSQVSSPIEYQVNIYGERQPPNDLILGETVPTNVAIHDATIDLEGLPTEFVTTSVTCANEILAITKIEVFDNDEEGFGGIVTDIDGEIGGHSVTISLAATSFGHGIKSTVRCFVVPVPGNSFTNGVLTPGSELRFSERVSGTGPAGELITATTTYNGTRVIRRVEALDQNLYGFGANLYSLVGGVGQTYATVVLVSNNGFGIDFLVNIYVEGDNNLFAGEIQDRTVLVHATRFQRPAIANQITSYNFTYNGDATTHDLSMVQVVDTTHDGNGGFVQIVEGGIGDKRVVLNFQSTISHSIDFWIAIFGNSPFDANDIMIGEFTAGDSLLYTSRFTMFPYTINVMEGTARYYGDREITMVQGLDLDRYGNGGFLVNHDISATNATLNFMSNGAGRGVDFIIDVYGH